MSFSICIYCFRSKLGVEQAKTNHAIMEKFPFAISDASLIKSGVLCSYGLHHEWTGDEEKPKQVHNRVSKDICIVCTCHRRNPLFKTNGCEHKFPEG